MAVYRRVEVASMNGSAGEVSLVKVLDRKITDQAHIRELGEELVALVEKDQKKNLILNFAGVEFLSSAALNELLKLDKKVKGAKGRLSLCNLKDSIKEVFVMTKLTKVFDIKNNEGEALAAM